ncbi:MAG: MoaD/ThiS family protein [Cyclobacteriaceae bacterium]
MILKIAAYGIARDILGANNIQYEVNDGVNTSELLTKLKTDYPDFQQLNSLLMAVNTEYAKPDQVIAESDEVVLIPPVSGG